MKAIRKRRFLIFSGLICLVLFTLTLSSVAAAAVGHSVSHSGSHSSSSSSSSSHSSSRSYSSGGGSSYPGGSIGNFLFLGYLFSHPGATVVLIFIIMIIYYAMKKSKGNTDYGYDMEEYQAPPVADLSALKSYDENFSEDMFISRVNNMFIQLQEAWMEKDWKRVRPFESDELFNMHNKQLQDLIRSNTTNVVEKIAILDTEIRGYSDDGTTESLDVYMRVRLHDYIIDDESRKVVEGDPQEEITMEYLLVMARKKGVKTRMTEGASITSCPNCGANVSINAAGECEYCNSIISNGDFDWVLTRLDVISQS